MKKAPIRMDGSLSVSKKPFQCGAVVMRLNLVRMPCRIPKGRPREKAYPL